MNRAAKGLLLLAAVTAPWLAAAPATAGGGCHRQPGSPRDSAGTSVELVGNCMSPEVLRVRPGTAVTFVNRDGILHNITGAWRPYAELAPGQSLVERFDDEGVFPFACTLHMGMSGAVVVGDDAPGGAATEPLASIATTPAARTTKSDGALTETFVAAAACGALGAAAGVTVGRRRRK